MIRELVLIDILISLLLLVYYAPIIIVEYFSNNIFYYKLDLSDVYILYSDKYSQINIPIYYNGTGILYLKLYGINESLLSYPRTIFLSNGNLYNLSISINSENLHGVYNLTLYIMSKYSEKFYNTILIFTDKRIEFRPKNENEVIAKGFDKDIYIDVIGYKFGNIILGCYVDPPLVCKLYDNIISPNQTIKVNVYVPIYANPGEYKLYLYGYYEK